MSACQAQGVSPAGVTKLACATPNVGQAILNGGIQLLADSRIRNLKKIRHLKAQTLLLRLPALSEIGEVIQYADISLNSEMTTLDALSAEAVRQQKTHQVILMHDLGDLREGGFYEEETLSLARKAVTLPGISLAGLGTNSHATVA